ncbi:MAG: hypothetical protein BIFFINMI_03858 [Phycisphaerae bacterium]|nr:hypothetical protein [Phycisphaerae bacterium]
MKVTCGSCQKMLTVEAWLADNVARCPKCNEIIQVPPAGSPDGAKAVVLTTEAATELLRRKARQEKELASRTGKSLLDLDGLDDAAASTSPSGPAVAHPSTGPKTEPLPAALRRAAGAIQPTVHEEPEKSKTRPLPAMPPVPEHTAPHADLTPAQRPQPAAVAAAPLEPADEEPRRQMFGPLVPVAFIAGLVIGALCGWLIARTGTHAPPASDQTHNSSDGVETATGPEPPPLVTNPVQPTPPGNTNTQPPTNNTTGNGGNPTPPNNTGRPPENTTQTPPPPVNPPTPAQVDRTAWWDKQPANPPVKFEGQPLYARRVAAVRSPDYPPNFFFFPAPPGMTYIEVRVRLEFDGAQPVSLKLGGPKADCWLVTGKGEVIDPLGRPYDDAAGSRKNPPYDADATLPLDKSQPVAEAVVLFLAPDSLSKAQFHITSGCFNDLPRSAVQDRDPTGGRAVEGQWTAVVGQNLLGNYPADQPVMAKLAAAGLPHDLNVQKQPDGSLKLSVDKAGVSGTLADKGNGYLQADLADGAGGTSKATVRLFDQGRLLTVYLSDQPYMQLTYRRAEQATPWDTPATPPGPPPTPAPASGPSGEGG